jgi:hypothetical protein
MEDYLEQISNCGMRPFLLWSTLLCEVNLLPSTGGDVELQRFRESFRTRANVSEH